MLKAEADYLEHRLKAEADPDYLEYLEQRLKEEAEWDEYIDAYINSDSDDSDDQDKSSKQ